MTASIVLLILEDSGQFEFRNDPRDVMCERDDPLTVNNTLTARWLAGFPTLVSGIKNINDEFINWYRFLIITGHFMSLAFHTT